MVKSCRSSDFTDVNTIHQMLIAAMAALIARATIAAEVPNNWTVRVTSKFEQSCLLLRPLRDGEPIDIDADGRNRNGRRGAAD